MILDFFLSAPSLDLINFYCWPVWNGIFFPLNAAIQKTEIFNKSKRIVENTNLIALLIFSSPFRHLIVTVYYVYLFFIFLIISFKNNIIYSAQIKE